MNPEDVPMPNFPDRNEYILKRKKRGKYKSGPYADLNLPPPRKPADGFQFQLPKGQKDEPPEIFPKQSTFWALKRQKWLCARCGVLVKFSDMSNWEADDIAQFKRDRNGEIKGYCEDCFEKEVCGE